MRKLSNWLSVSGPHMAFNYSCEIVFDGSSVDELQTLFNNFSSDPSISIDAVANIITMTFNENFYDFDKKIFPLIDLAHHPRVFVGSFVYYPIFLFNSNNKIQFYFYNDSNRLDFSENQESFYFGFNLITPILT